MIKFTSHGWGDYTSWSDDRKVLKRINRLIQEAARDPASGIGKPERLKEELSGYWSRRIDHEHRLVYTVDADGDLVILQARDHYERWPSGAWLNEQLTARAADPLLTEDLAKLAGQTIANL